MWVVWTIEQVCKHYMCVSTAGETLNCHCESCTSSKTPLIIGIVIGVIFGIVGVLVGASGLIIACVTTKQR